MGRQWIRTAGAALALTLLGACSKGGINAGVDGGVAFIAFTGMLIVAGIILWLAIGRED
jgi:hypothetical protein